MTNVDLHIHTGLSACAENVMSPRRIFERAAEKNVTIVALTDHNASANIPGALKIVKAFPELILVPGMELTTREEVHLLALFSEFEPLADLQKLIDSKLPELQNDPEFFGYQLVYDENDEIVDVDMRFRQVGVDLPLNQAMAAIHERGGFAVPAHVLRKKYSLTSQLGFIDGDAEFDAVEVSWRDWRLGGHKTGDRLGGYPLITGSDSHFIEDVGRRMMPFDSSLNTIEQVMFALRAS